MGALLVYKQGSTLNPAWKLRADGASPISKYGFFFVPLPLFQCSQIPSQGGARLPMLPTEILND